MMYTCNKEFEDFEYTLTITLNFFKFQQNSRKF
jgi:hypothetical protein